MLKKHKKRLNDTKKIKNLCNQPYKNLRQHRISDSFFFVVLIFFAFVGAHERTLGGCGGGYSTHFDILAMKGRIFFSLNTYILYTLCNTYENCTYFITY